MKHIILIFALLVTISSCSWLSSSPNSSQEDPLSLEEADEVDADLEFLKDEEVDELEGDFAELEEGSEGESDLESEFDLEEEGSEDVADDDDLLDDELDLIEDEDEIDELEPVAEATSSSEEQKSDSLEDDSLTDGELDLDATSPSGEEEELFAAEEDKGTVLPKIVEIPTEEPVSVAVPVEKTWIPVKKMATQPYRKNGILVNALYIARQGEELRSIGVKVGRSHTTHLLQVNPHLKKYSDVLPVGTKVYYNSPVRPSDDSQMLNYYEDNQIEATVFVAQDGDNLRQVGKKLLGHSRSWQELWAYNVNLDSKGELVSGTQIKYWSDAATPRVVEKVEPPVVAEIPVAVEGSAPSVVADTPPPAEDAPTTPSSATNPEVVADTPPPAEDAPTTPSSATNPEVVEDTPPPLLSDTSSASPSEPSDTPPVVDAPTLPVADEVPPVVKKPPTPPPAAVAPVVEVKEEGLLSFLENDFVLIGLAVFLLLLIFLIYRSKKRKVSGQRSIQEEQVMQENTLAFIGGEQTTGMKDETVVDSITGDDQTLLSTDEGSKTQMEHSKTVVDGSDSTKSLLDESLVFDELEDDKTRDDT